MQRSITRKSINDYKQYLLAAEKAKATVTKYINEAERLAEYLNGAQLSKRALLEYRETLAENFSSRTVNTKLAAINGYLAFIGADEYKVHLLKVQRKAFIAENRELSAAEYKRLVNAADAGGNERLSLVMQTICATGIRISELSYITVDAVKERRMEIRLKDKSRTVIIPSKLCKKLVEYARRQRIDTGAVFRTKGGKTRAPWAKAGHWGDLRRLSAASQGKSGSTSQKTYRSMRRRCAMTQENGCGRGEKVLCRSVFYFRIKKGRSDHETNDRGDPRAVHGAVQHPGRSSGKFRCVFCGRSGGRGKRRLLSLRGERRRDLPDIRQQGRRRHDLCPQADLPERRYVPLLL